MRALFIILSLWLLVAACGSNPSESKGSNSNTQTTVVKPPPKYSVGQYVWVDGVTKAYIYRQGSGCGCNESSDGAGYAYDIAMVLSDGEHHISLRENRLFATPDTFYHKIVLPERLYQELASKSDTLFSMQITSQKQINELRKSEELLAKSLYSQKLESANLPKKNK